MGNSSFYSLAVADAERDRFVGPGLSRGGPESRPLSRIIHIVPESRKLNYSSSLQLPDETFFTGLKGEKGNSL